MFEGAEVVTDPTPQEMDPVWAQAILSAAQERVQVEVLKNIELSASVAVLKGQLGTIQAALRAAGDEINSLKNELVLETFTDELP